MLKVTDSVWVARGYNRDNPVLIEGVDGLIVVDPGESIPAAQKVKDAFNANLDNIFEKKPVKAIIYTHHMTVMSTVPLSLPTSKRRSSVTRNC